MIAVLSKTLLRGRGLGHMRAGVARTTLLLPSASIPVRSYRPKEPSFMDLAQGLDGHKSTNDPLPAKMRKKLGDAIEKSSSPKESHPMLDGLLDAEAEDISELLNAALETSTFETLLPWARGNPANFLSFDR